MTQARVPFAGIVFDAVFSAVERRSRTRRVPLFVLVRRLIA